MNDKKMKMVQNTGITVLKAIILSALLSSFVFIAGCGQKAVKPEDQDQAVIVTVDGLSFINTITGFHIEKRNDYLHSNLETIMKKETILPFHWSGDVKDTAAALKPSGKGSLRELLRNSYKEAREKRKAFVVISHSWGTFLSYLALSMEPEINCDLFITLSCPLGSAAGLPRSAERTVRDYTDDNLAKMSFHLQSTNFPRVRSFYNFWAKGDVISGSLSNKVPAALNVRDERVDDGISVVRDVKSSLFWHEFTTLGDEVLAGANYLPYFQFIVSYGKEDIYRVRNKFITQVVSLINSASF